MRPRDLEKLLSALGYITMRYGALIEVYRDFQEQEPFASFNIINIARADRASILSFLDRCEHHRHVLPTEDEIKRVDHNTGPSSS